MQKTKFLTKQLGSDRKMPVVIEVGGYIDDQFGYYRDKLFDRWQAIDLRTGLSCLKYKDTPQTREEAKTLALKNIERTGVYDTDEYQVWENDFQRMCKEFRTVNIA